MITFYACLVSIVLSSAAFLQAFQIDSDGGLASGSAQQGDLDLTPYFIKTKLYITDATVVTDPLALQTIAKDALMYLNQHDVLHAHVTNPKRFSQLLSLHKVKQTLRFLIDVIEEDKATGTFRILDPLFLNKHFSCISWRADEKNAAAHGVTLPGNGQIRLTTYSVFSVKGSSVRSIDFPCALYHVTNDAIARRFTKQQVIAGALDAPAMRPYRKIFAWVSRQSLEEALMQGTVLVEMPDGSSKLLRVHLHNGHQYNRQLGDRQHQKKYWYFKELGRHGYSAANRIKRIKKRKQVVFAGDLHNIGLGKLIAIRYKNPHTDAAEIRLGILADTGGAFKDNLYQLDFFAGLVPSHDALRTIIQQVPIYVHASFLYKI
jgi:hypothetical protein